MAAQLQEHGMPPEEIGAVFEARDPGGVRGVPRGMKRGPPRCLAQEKATAVHS